MANPPGLAVGYTWSGYTNHWARLDTDPIGDKKQYAPLCTRSGVYLYVPGHSVMPHHLSHVYPKDLKWCQACVRRQAPPGNNDPATLPPGTVVYYNIFYDGLHHQLAEKLTNDEWHLYQDDGNYSSETRIPEGALDRFDITVVHSPPPKE